MQISSSNTPSTLDPSETNSTQPVYTRRREFTVGPHAGTRAGRPGPPYSRSGTPATLSTMNAATPRTRSLRSADTNPMTQPGLRPSHRPQAWLAGVLALPTTSRDTNVGHNQMESAARALEQAVRHWLGQDMSEAVARWNTIAQTLASDNANAVVPFIRFLNRLRGTINYKNADFRAGIQEWLTELSKPERKSLLESSLQVCVGATQRCDDRVVLVLNELTKMRVHDDIRLGRYNERIADALDMMRQMFYLRLLLEISHRKFESLCKIKSRRKADDVEIHLAYTVKLREPLRLSMVASDMKSFKYSYITQDDLNAALHEVREAERAGFYKYLVLDDTWNALLKQKLGALYEEAERRLEILAGAPLLERIRAELQKRGLDPHDNDAQREIGKAVWDEMRYKVLEPLTHRLSTAEGVPLPARPQVQPA